jgi:cytochrome c biogenesis protein CcmG, thiol:disulfide interchange protein DsbE
VSPARPIAVLLALAVATTVAVVAIVGSAKSGDVAVGEAVPNVTGTTLDGGQFELASVRGRPVIINFWKPSCVPCRTEFPLLAAKATEHDAEGLVIVGVMSDDPVELARQFAAQYGSSWSSVIDAGGAIKAAYRVIAWPQTYFVDAAGILRSIQIGEVTEPLFERQYALIAGGR